MSNRNVYRLAKLVRDGIPELMQDEGDIATVRTLSPAEVLVALRDKMTEELAELTAARTSADQLSELADLYEVLVGLCQAHQLDLAQVVAEAARKAAKRGGFQTGAWVDTVACVPGSHSDQRYAAEPDRFPLLPPLPTPR
mgnify:FL=1